MSENPIEPQEWAGMKLDKERYTITPSGKADVNLLLSNQGLENDVFTLSVQGVPSAWITLPQAVVSLSSGEEKEITFIIQAPALGKTERGDIQLTVQAASQRHPGQTSEVKAVLTVVDEKVPDRVALELVTAQLAVAPGSSTTFQLKMKNNGIAPDMLRLFIDGIPSGWISTSSPVSQLAPGEEKDIYITISPPRDFRSQAGRHRITIRFTSQVTPEQEISQEAILTIGAFLEFESELQPEGPLEALTNAQLNVTNKGNYSEVFQVEWQSDADVLAFELVEEGEDEQEEFMEVQEHTVKVAPGAQETTHFRASLRKRPWVGGSKSYPFQVNVRPSQETAAEGTITHRGEISERAKIPIWVIPLVLVLCVSLVCLGAFIYNRMQDDTQPVEDASWTRVQEAGVLRVATAADYPPFSYYNDNYAIDGFDPALIREIGNVLSVGVSISDYAFDGIGNTLRAGQADVVIAAISVTEERKQQFDFSNIYYVGEDGILALQGSPINQITNPGQMTGQRVGVQRKSVYERWAQDVLVGGGIIAQNQLFSYEKPEHATADLRAGRLDLVIMDLQPATLTLADGDFKLVGKGLNQQRLAIAVLPGANALRSKINEALLTLQNQGRVNQLIQVYLGLRPEDIIPPPTPEPTPVATATPLPTATADPTPEACIDAMEFVSHLNYDANNLANFPQVDPGEAFQKGWRIRNVGTCTWNSTYFINYVDGNDPAAQMGGQPTAIKGAVEPGQTYDMYVDLVAPAAPGRYVGYWQMHSPDNKAFGQTVVVAVRVRAPEPATPTPEPTAMPTETVPPLPTDTETPPQPTDIPPEPTSTVEPGANLRDTTWVLEGYRVNIEDEDLTVPIPELIVSIVFREDGNLEINGGCNTFSGRYVTDGVQIVFNDLLGTNLICSEPDSIMDQEAAILTLLDRIEEYRITEVGRLELIRYVREGLQRVEKVLLLFSDLRIEPR